MLLLMSLSLTAASHAQTETTSNTPAATTTEKPKRVVFRATKDQVKEAQTIFKDKNLYTGEVTGKSNADWKAAVKNYQSENGLTKSGSLNRATLEKLGIALTDKQKLIPVSASSFATAKTPKEPKPKTVKATSVPTTPAAGATGDMPKRPAPFRANEEQIKAAQKMLKDGKMYSGEETGKLDDATRESLKKYQEANGLRVLGSLNAATLEKMGIALTDGQKSQVAAQAAYDAAKSSKN